MRRVTRYHAAGMGAPLEVLALLEVHDVPASKADERVAGARHRVVELGGGAAASRGWLLSDGWDGGGAVVSGALVGIAGREWSRCVGWSVGAADLAVHLADVRQRERGGLERFVREDMLPRRHLHTTVLRRVVEALGEAGGLCTARARGADGDVVVCTLEPGAAAWTRGRRSEAESRAAGARRMRRSGTTRWRPALRRPLLKDHRN